MNKLKWFPKKLIQQKRQHIKRIIEDLLAGRFETIDQYLIKRDTIIKESKKNSWKFNTFCKLAFCRALAAGPYAKTCISSNEKVCLMLDYYYSEKNVQFLIDTRDKDNQVV